VETREWNPSEWNPGEWNGDWKIPGNHFHTRGDIMTEIPIAPVERIIRKAGAERISSDAGKELVLLLEEYADKLAREAVKLASYSGRSTVRGRDIRMAGEILK